PAGRAPAIAAHTAADRPAPPAPTTRTSSSSPGLSAAGASPLAVGIVVAGGVVILSLLPGSQVRVHCCGCLAAGALRLGRGLRRPSLRPWPQERNRRRVWCRPRPAPGR